MIATLYKLDKVHDQKTFAFVFAQVLVFVLNSILLEILLSQSHATAATTRQS
jgi:hypothetical protein